MRQEVSFSKLKLTNNKGSTNNVAQVQSPRCLCLMLCIRPESFIFMTLVEVKTEHSTGRQGGENWANHASAAKGLSL